MSKQIIFIIFTTFALFLTISLFQNLFFLFFVFYIILMIFSTVFRKILSKKGIFFLLTGFIFLFFINTIFQLNSISLNNKFIGFVISLTNINWFFLEINLDFRLDGLSYFFVLLVLAIGFATNIYTLHYFKYEAHEDNFLLLINWFIISMLILVLANNLLTLFLGWELIGLTSFFLINFWNQKKNVMKSSFKAFFFNKFSDAALFFFVTYVYSLFSIHNLNTLNLNIANQLTDNLDLFKLVSASLILCSMFKSAQLIGHLWLPDSMEAPLPASALIHSATLVSAGVYLLLRFSNLINLFQMQNSILILGSLTAAYGGIIAASQTDLKKLLAYSTISHCGFLFVSLGLEVYYVTITYLYLHGLFKALTFYCAGSFIRVSGSQDTRLMGGLNRLLPVDTIFILICSINLGGLPFTFGYINKQSLIIAITNSNISNVLLGFIFIGLLSSIVYIFKINYYTCFDIIKDTINPIILELQQKQINIKSSLSFTTNILIISITILFFFSFFIYIYFLNTFFNSCLIIEYSNFTIDTSQIFLYNQIGIFKYIFELFYSIYTLIVVILFLLVWRIEFSFIQRLNNIYTFTLTTFLIIFYSNIYSNIL